MASTQASLGWARIRTELTDTGSLASARIREYVHDDSASLSWARIHILEPGPAQPLIRQRVDGEWVPQVLLRRASPGVWETIIE